MASATAEQSNKVTVSDAGPSRKKISIEIPAAVVTERLEQSMTMIVRDAELPGYRRGRAPRQLIEKRFGAGVRSEAKQQLISAAYSQAIEDHKLQVIGEPVGEGLAAVELVSGQPFAFEIEVEILPEFELPSLEGVALKKPVIQIDEQVIDKELETLSINEGALESREVAEPGDYLTGHALMKADADGKVFYDLKGAVVQVPTEDKNGKGMILGVLVEDFSKQLGLPKPSDTVTITVTGPENHEVDALRGTPVTITFEVERVDRIIPAPTETLVQLFGMENETQLRETLRKRAEQQIRIRQHTVMRTQVSKHLVESTSIDLPERITAQQAARTLDRKRMELMYRGASVQDIEMHIAELRESSSKIAERELRLSFILNKAASLLNVRIDESDVNNYIVQMAASQGARPDQLRQQLIQQNQIPGIVQTIREHKTLDAIVSKGTITEMTPDEYNALVQAGQV